MDDRAAVALQLGREPRTFRRVVARCPWGMPAVTEQDPYGPDGEPFPTTYYLTCRHLVAAVSRLEAAGGVERWSAAVADERARCGRAPAGDGGAGADPATSSRRGSGDRRGSVARVGIGGSRNPGALKCLHAHVAYALAQPGYRLGEDILAELPERWPRDVARTAISVASRR